jgi:diaminobutyrate-2-oxoglutarate transaminase
MVAASGCVVRDRHGRDYIDCLAGAGALALGHHHPVVTQAVRKAIDDGVPMTTLDFSTPVRDAFIDELFAVLPPTLQHNGRIQFCGPSGADAVEAAVKLAKTATGRGTVIAFGGAYHGMTQGTLALSGSRAVKQDLGTLQPDVHHLPFPATSRSPLANADGSDSAARLLEWALADEQSGMAAPAAVIAEPVQGEGGVHPMPASFARAMRRAATAAGAVVIADEVQTGLGRTGTMWAGDPLGLDPDVLVLSKAIGGGLPLAVLVYREDLDVWRPGAHAGTFRGPTLSLAAGAATIREVAASGLAERAAELGRRLIDGLAAVSDGDGRISEVRGRGLMVGVETVNPAVLDSGGVPVHDGELAGRLQREMLRRGVIVEVGGARDAVIRFLPPLIISEAELDQVIGVFAAALREVR